MKLVTSFILLRLDYCNFHLSGLLASSVHTFVASRTVLLASSWGGGGGGGGGGGVKLTISLLCFSLFTGSQLLRLNLFGVSYFHTSQDRRF